MAAPDTKFIFDDQTEINPNTGFDNDTTNRATFMTVFSSDKGPETLQKNLSGNDFFSLYGDSPNFFKHGQPLLQAAKIANAGGLQYCKRVVAKDSKLANLGLFAIVSESTIQQTDSKGRPLYYTTKNVEGYWSLTTTDDSAETYVEGNQYTAGTVVVKDGAYYKALVDADTSQEEQRIGATFKDTTTIKPSTGSDMNDYPTVKAANIKYQLLPLPDELQNNNTSDISSVIKTVENLMLLDKDDIITTATGETGYLLLTFTDVGRGQSGKRIRITADTSTRRPVSYVKYKVEVIENNSTIETHYCAFDPYIVESTDGTVANAKNISFEKINNESDYIRCKFYEDEYNNFVNQVASISSVAMSDVDTCDILFSYDKYGKSINTIEIDDESSSLDATNGNGLQNGSNGAFGDYPIKLTAEVADDGTTTGLSKYYEQVLEVFDGTFSDDIYDLDNTRIDVIFDANYPLEIKDAIATLVNFREDCFFFRDLGLGLTTIEAIEAASDTLTQKSKFIADYANSFYVIEPYYRKQVQVTMPYLLVDKFATHYINGVSRPFCGQRYGITFSDEIVDGTLNFYPKRTPKTDDNVYTYDQKQWFDDNRLNYIAYYNGIPTMDIEYTTQEKYTQLTWIHNVLTVQAMMHDIRKQCPKSRYAFIYDTDYTSYKADIEKVINSYSGYFKNIEIEYVKDDQYDLNKIFYAVIKITFKDFIQSEIFKLTMINSTSNTSD
jgi:hypothetical protein